MTFRSPYTAGARRCLFLAALAIAAGPPHRAIADEGGPTEDSSDSTADAARSDPGGGTSAAPTSRADEATSTGSYDPTGAAGPSAVDWFDTIDPGGGLEPVGDRWRVGFPTYDRLGRRHPLDPFTMGGFSGNYQYNRGLLWDPYNQNVLKGDYPILGQHTFMNVTLTTDFTFEYRQLPTPAGDSTEEPDTRSFFGDRNQHFFALNVIAKIDVFHGSAAFKPFDWRIRITPVLNLTWFDPNEQGIVDIDAREDTFRRRKDFAIQELFLELKLGDVSPQYDFVSVRLGRQTFVSDFRGFIFNDVNQGVRLFGSSEANRNQWNVLYFFQAEKETNSELNEWDARHQHVVITNLYRQDSLDFSFLPPAWRKGYTQQLSFHFNYDDQNTRKLHFDKNGFLVRPDPVGSFTPHDVYVGYFGWTGDGHIDRLNLTHAAYWAVGRDGFNSLADQKLTINSQMLAIEPSIDFDWFRLRTSAFWASGDKSPLDREGRGFDAIFDNPNFAGGPFSFWNRQAIRLLGVNLVNRNSLVPDLSSSKIQGQSNFVNPGIFILNAGADVEITPKIKGILNASYLWFDQTQPLEHFLKQKEISREIGADLGIGMQYRPFLNNNVVFTVGFSTLIPGEGLSQIYETEEPFYSVFTNVALTF